jgi:hypothetical protein
MHLDFDGVEAEADFVAFRADDRRLEGDEPPKLVIGEAKSLGLDVFTRQNLEKVKVIATKFRGSVIVFAVLRDRFTDREKKLLKTFVEWGRRGDLYDKPTNPVLLLTATELLSTDTLIAHTWKKLGDPHRQFAGHEHTSTLVKFCDATQAIYLGMPSYFKVRAEYWRKRIERAEQLRRSKQQAD